LFILNHYFYFLYFNYFVALAAGEALAFAVDVEVVAFSLDAGEALDFAVDVVDADDVAFALVVAFTVADVFAVVLAALAVDLLSESSLPHPANVNAITIDNANNTEVTFLNMICSPLKF